jgi:hypothetical protein
MFPMEMKGLCTLRIHSDINVVMSICRFYFISSTIILLDIRGFLGYRLVPRMPSMLFYKRDTTDAINRRS